MNPQFVLVPWWFFWTPKNYWMFRENFRHILFLLWPSNKVRKKMSALWDQISELLDIWPGSRTLTFICLHPSTFRSFHSYRSSYCLQLSFVMYIMPDTLWSCQSFERDTPLTDRWMFLCFVVRTFGQLQLHDNPTGPKTADSERTFFTFLQQECSVFWLVFQGSGDISVHHILVAGKHLWRRKDSPIGVFWRAKNAWRFCAKIIVMMHHALTHGTQWICWCM